VGASNKTVRASGVTIKDGAGADMSGNYTISYVDNTTSTITAAPLSVGAVTDSKVYNASPSSLQSPVVSGLHGADSVSSASQVFDSKNAGVRILLVSGYKVNDGNGGNNYSVRTPIANGTISKAVLPIEGLRADNKTYDSTSQATLVGVPTVAPYKGDEVFVNSSKAVASFVDKFVATGKSVAASGYNLDGINAANYRASQPIGLIADIVPTQENISLIGTQLPWTSLSPTSKFSTIQESSGVQLHHLDVVVPLNVGSVKTTLNLQMPQSVIDYFKGVQVSPIAELIDGRPLPEWIHFEPQTLGFSIKNSQITDFLTLSIKSANKALLVNLSFR
jgi:hypothetical protein